MDDMKMRKLATIAIILHVVIGFVWSLSPIELDHETFSYSTSNKTGNFSFSDCGSKHSLLKFEELNISPHPIIFDRFKPKYVTTNGTYVVTRVIPPDAKIEVDINWRLKTPDGYTELCELIGEDKCHFNDLIKELEDRLHSLTPILALTPGPHRVRNATTHVGPLPFILRGTFQATANIKQQGQQLGCLRINFCITECLFL